jgi:hypothetical protein
MINNNTLSHNSEISVFFASVEKTYSFYNTVIGKIEICSLSRQFERSLLIGKILTMG